MRDYAIDVLRDAVPPAEQLPPKPTGSSPASLNPFAFGIPMLLVGGFLTPIFPPLGITLAGFGVLVCLIGLIIAAGRSVWGKLRTPRTGPPDEA